MINYAMFSIPKTPTTMQEMLDLLDPQAREFDSPLTIISRLAPSHRRALVDLASQFREAETPEDKASAAESLRSGLLALGFGEAWVKQVVPRVKAPAATVKADIPYGSKTAGADWKQNRDYHESVCRYFSTTEGEPDGNQGGFTE